MAKTDRSAWHEMIWNDTETAFFVSANTRLREGGYLLNLVDLIVPLILIGLLFGRPVKNGYLRTGHRNVQKAGFRIVSNYFVPFSTIFRGLSFVKSLKLLRFLSGTY